MTLPKETIEKISTDASERYPASPDGMLMAAGYAAGATEWAGKVEDLIDTLQKVKNIMSWMDGDDRYCQALRKIVEPALAKYKEVGNGG